jgi:hypothetical protein
MSVVCEIVRVAGPLGCRMPALLNRADDADQKHEPEHSSNATPEDYGVVECRVVHIARFLRCSLFAWNLLKSASWLTGEQHFEMSPVISG